MRDQIKLDLEMTSTSLEFQLKNNTHFYKFCYSSDIYFATSNELIYTKITTVSPYYIVLNQSSKTIIFEQSEQPERTTIHLILEPGQRQSYQFYNF